MPRKQWLRDLWTGRITQAEYENHLAHISVGHSKYKSPLADFNALKIERIWSSSFESKREIRGRQS